MIKKIKGIIINDTAFKESSKILNVLTEDGKIISLMAKGVKKNNSILKAKTTKFSYGYFYTYYKEDKISTLTNVDIINDFKNIKNDLELISYLNYLVELSSSVIKHSANKEIFTLLITALEKINEGLDPLVIKNILEIKYLDFLGLKLNLDSCNICGVTLSTTHGGFVCQDCADNNIITSIKTIKMIRNYYYVELSSIKELNISESVKKEIDKFLDEMYENYTGLYLKSKKFLKNIVNL